MVQRSCNCQVFFSAFGLNREDFKKGATAIAVSAPELLVQADGLGELTADYFAAGYVASGSGTNRHIVAIFADTIISSTVRKLTLPRSLNAITVDQVLALYPGCGKCRARSSPRRAVACSACCARILLSCFLSLSREVLSLMA